MQNIAYISRKNIKNLYKFWYYWKRGEILMKWLHLSDLHIRENADWNIFRQELVEHCKVNGPIDLVIVTGDFHDFKDKDDFSLAESFLKELMEERGVTRNALARATNTRFEVINKWYQGHVEKIDADVLARICYILDCNPGDIILYKVSDE